MWIDADGNGSTGDDGVEFNLYLQGSDLTSYAARWNGSAWVDWVPPTARAGYANGVWTLMINRTDLNNTGLFDFYLQGSKYGGQVLVGQDDAPELSVSAYTYTLAQAPPPPPPAPQPRPKTYNDGPKLPSRIRYIGKSIKHVRLGEKLYSTMKRLGAPRVVGVACWSKADWPSVAESAGYEGNPNLLSGFWLPRQPRWIHVAPKECSDVQALMLTRQSNGQRAYALTTVLHERVHAEGVSNEAQTNCYAVQLVYDFATELNFVPTKAFRLEQLAVRKSRAVAPRGYWDTGRCRDGGKWDLFPEFRNLDY